ncbi:MAG: excinuclease ABC subunit B [Omnitrophica bacterium GWA2_52_8]|nr:MAG: excinuclease ABC subunit B [Omnitrophica bacterium GWA2_52_8]
MPIFSLSTKFKPCGDQPEAIRSLVRGYKQGRKEQVLLGVTGSGKTFTVANVIAQFDMPVLVMSHNKTLAAQLYSELKDFFPENAVEYFVSYYDYYQPEAYIPYSDTYIEKDASINDDLDRLRLAATSAVLSRRDCIIVSSVSCIYGLGAPEDWQKLLVRIARGGVMQRDELLSALIAIQYERTETELKRGAFWVRGNRVDLFPSYGEHPYRIEFEDAKIRGIQVLEAGSMKPVRDIEQLAIYPAKHFVTTPERIGAAMTAIQEELNGRLKELRLQNKDLEAQRLESRTRYDMEMLREVGYCSGIENYSRHLSGRAPGSTPYTLLDYFPKEFLTVIDESHQSIPQIRGMFQGDMSRKKVLVEHGFRLPSAMDNRPLKFAEFERKIGRMLYVSATPGPYEMQRNDAVVRQIIRPTGLMDPEIEVRKTEFQIDDLIREIKERAKAGERTLVTTLTKKMAEDLSRYLKDVGIKVSYLHSEFDAFERVEILRDLRKQKYDCVIGVNLLREGLDLPEVSLVAILDADKEGFLRSDVSLIQIAGRAARHVRGKVIMYGDKMTRAMKTAIDETGRRREIQSGYNQKNGITPQSIRKEIREGIEKWKAAEDIVAEVVGESQEEYRTKSYLAYLKSRMEQAAHALQFDKAARYRDEIRKVEAKEGLRTSVLTPSGSPQPAKRRGNSSARRKRKP